MAATNPKTRALYTRLEEVLGGENADTLMTHLPSEPGAELATTLDLGALEATLDQRFDRIDQRFEKIDQRFEQLDQRLFSLHELLNTQYKNYSITMVGGMTALTGIYAGLVAVLALLLAG
jgi:hypothetical protein